MYKSLLHALAFTSPLLLLTGCIDDNYDLSNADTTTRLTVNDLVLPVNIDPIRLGDVIKFDEGSKIQPVTLGGKEFYALVQDGSFESEDINIAGVSATPSPINPTVETLERLINPDSKRRAPQTDFVYVIDNIGNTFTYDAVNIDEAIVKLGQIETAPFDFLLTLEIQDYDNAIKEMSFTDMRIRAPKGLDAVPSVGRYDKATGIWTISQVDVVGNRTEVSLRATGVDCEIAGVRILPDRTLDFQSQFIMEEGLVHIVPNAGVFPNPDHVVFTIGYGLDDFEVKSFSGRIRYRLDGLAIDPVNLTDIPDFLKGGETNIEMANPQIYLQINNPVGDVPLDLSTGLTLTAQRNGLSDLRYTLDRPVVIDHAYGVAGPYNFVLSPSSNNLNVPDMFDSHLQWYQFSTLGSLLATPSSWTEKGIPDRIAIDLTDAGVPEQDVNGFVIPRTLPAARGQYEIVAPLALNDGSHVIYTETRDGWSDDDLDKLTVTRLVLTAHAKNNCPVSLQLTVVPIDTDGHELDAKVQSNTLEANTETELTIELTGEVRHLDGIRLRAVLESGASGEPLSPEQTLDLTDIRARVSGYYETDF